MDNLTSRIDLGKIYPPFLDRWIVVITDLRDRGFKYKATLGFRTYEEQNELYQKGRDGAGRVVRKADTVTDARGGYSMHNFGLAVDHMYLNLSGFGEWDEMRYTELGRTAQRAGLQWGVPGRVDLVHVQVPAYRWFGLNETELLSECRKAYTKGGLPTVWKRLDASIAPVQV